jgi:hypothetical protein
MVGKGPFPSGFVNMPVNDTCFPSLLLLLDINVTLSAKQNSAAKTKISITKKNCFLYIVLTPYFFR